MRRPATPAQCRSAQLIVGMWRGQRMRCRYDMNQHIPSPRVCSGRELNGGAAAANGESRVSRLGVAIWTDQMFSVFVRLTNNEASLTMAAICQWGSISTLLQSAGGVANAQHCLFMRYVADREQVGVLQKAPTMA